MNHIDDDERDEPAVRVYGMPDRQNRQPEPIQGLRGENAGSGDAGPETRRHVTTGDGRSFDIVETSGRAAGEAAAAERRMNVAPAPGRTPAKPLPGLLLAFGAGMGLAVLLDTAFAGAGRQR